MDQFTQMPGGEVTSWDTTSRDHPLEPEHSPSAGRPHPLGATVMRDGTNFSLFSQHAEAVELLLFDAHDNTHPTATIALDSAVNKTFHYWHVFVPEVRPGTQYAFRVSGPNEQSNGHRFDAEKVLVEPYARGNDKSLWQRGDACGPGDNLTTSLRSVVIDTHDYDWEGDRPLNRPLNETVIYEMHVGGFTRSASATVEHPGTFNAVIEKIPYLQKLGITAVELLPVFEFDDTEIRIVDGLTLSNYWGYSTMSYFAPHPSYCTSPRTGDHVRGFRDMVKALHKAGIEVILDVVFNHTDEGNHQGPTFSFKGIDNSNYYYLSPEDRRFYYDYSGCGNTFNCNHPMGTKFILECLRYWVKEMHVDGFRFDEASVLSRDEQGSPSGRSPILWQIETDEDLADTKLFAEAWDAAGLYQVGHFPGYRWGEWNGHYRDDVRRFVKGDPGMVGAVASRIAGSADLYQWRGHLPVNSVNFVTAHDGFTLNDLVSYNEKHNWLNGENNNDGINENLSWNCGAEGETSDAGVLALRERQIKNFATIMMLSQGIPMMVMGDEVRRTQQGNNNAYCQDNEIGWFQWDDVDQHADMLRFWQEVIAFRQRHSSAHRSRHFDGSVNRRGLPDIAWHGVELNAPGWQDTQARALAFTLGGSESGADIHVMMNMHWESLRFEVPPISDRNWHRAIDTHEPSPEDIAVPGKEPKIAGKSYPVGARSIVVLISK